MIAVAAGLLTALTLLVWPVRRGATHRLRRIVAAEMAGDRLLPPSPKPAAVRPVAAMAVVCSGLAGFLGVGGLVGVVMGSLCAGVVLAVMRRREPAEVRARRTRMTADLPFAVDLMVACLRAGQPLLGAIETAAQAVGGPLGERLGWVGVQVRLGADPETAWAALTSDPPLATLARTMIRTVRGGAPVAEALVWLADDARNAARAAALAAARKVGVQAVAPLGLCFLPAFVILGIVPVVAGLAAQILSF